MKKLLIVTDAWHPQINGAVVATEQLIKVLNARGWSITLIHPGQFATVPMPLYKEIKLSLFPKYTIRKVIKELQPDYIHVMTEGPIGWATSRVCKENNIAFTSSYHTHFQIYMNMRMPVLYSIVLHFMRRFHNGSACTMVSTESLQKELQREGFTNVVITPLGVDTERFVRNDRPVIVPLPSPVFVFFSRLAQEKSPEEFLQLTLPGTKLVIGGGPDRAKLEKKYGKQYGGDSTFVGYKKGQELVDYLSMSDVMIFPSRTETFGLVVLEALACGVPVAAHQVMGPRDIITEGKDGYLSDDLKEAALKCLDLKKEDCRQKALQYSWEHSTDTFISHLVPIKKLS